MTSALVAGLAAWVLALGLTPVVRHWATQRGWVCQPRPDRWAERPVALMGGVAIVGAFYLTVLPFSSLFGRGEAWLLGVSFAMFVMGVVDDRRHLKPQTKLIAQLVAALALIEAGFRIGLPGDGLRVGDKVLTVVWLVGIGNALNLLDNMDGLCAGIAAIAAGFLGLIQLDGNVPAAVLCFALAGSCVGYLRYNRWPASIFMGDGGSLFLGFFLGGAVLLGPGDGAGRGVLAVVALPVLLMLAPLMDTTLVTIARKWWRRPVSVGGKDHSSHRLVAIGLSEPRAVRLLYLLGVAGGLAALAVRWLDWYVSSLLLPVLLFAVGALGWSLGRVRVYEGESLGDLLDQTPIPLLGQHRHRRRLVEVVIDTLALAAGFYIANALRYEGALALPEHLAAFAAALPMVIAAHLVAYAVAGVYRGVWRYTSVSDVPRFAVAVMLGLLLSTAGLWATGRLAGLAKSVFAIHALVQMGFLTGTRISVKLLRDRLLAAREKGEHRVLLVGVGEEAELSLRCLRRDRELELVGTVCEEPGAVGLRVLDTPILGTSDDIEDLLRDLQVSRVVLLDSHYPLPGWQRIREACASSNIAMQVVKHRVEPADLVCDGAEN